MDQSNEARQIAYSRVARRAVVCATRRAIVRTIGAVAAAFGIGSPALAGGTPAGTSIDNVATATYDGPAGTQSVTSNVVKLRVDELLGVVLASSDPGPVAAGNGEVGKALRFQITNSGNGPEAFSLTPLSTIGGDDFDPGVTSLVLDTNVNGAYDPGIDLPYVAGGNDPLLAPDQSVTVFLLSSMPATAANGARGIARLIATATTGSGAPGTFFAGAGQGGGDAVVGSTKAQAQAEGVYALASVSVAFVKSATVLDPFGGARVVPGSIVTYQLRADLTGSGSLSNLRVGDTIPAGTTYKPGSITLAGVAQTDAADTDAGAFASSAVSVAIGTAAAGSSHIVTFQVRID